MDANLTKRNGVVTMDKDFDLMCSLLRNGEYTVKIVRKTQPRTISQNSLMWMWYKCMEEATGTPKEMWLSAGAGIGFPAALLTSTHCR